MPLPSKLPGVLTRRSRKIKTGLLVLCLMLSLMACSSRPNQPQGDTRIPPELLRGCPAPESPTERTVGGLVGWIREAQVVIRDCNDDKEALREWDRRVLGGSRG